MFVLLVKWGLRAREISHLTWSIVTDASSQISDTLHLPDNFSKGKSGRIILLNTPLKKALIGPYEDADRKLSQHLIFSERDKKTLPLVSGGI